MIIASLLNQKGGVGKTSCTFHLAGAVARSGRRVLMLDLDPQSSLSQGIFGPAAALALDPASTAHAVLSGEEPFPSDVIRDAGIPGIDIVAGSEACTSLNVPDPHLLDAETQGRLASFLSECEGIGYDLVLIDSPPNIHFCAWAALAASHHVVVPMQPEEYGAQGIDAMRRAVAKVKAHANPGLEVAGYLLTMVGRRAIHASVEKALRKMYGDLVFRTTVPDNPAYVEAVTARKPVGHYKPKSAASKAMDTLAVEFFSRVSPALVVTPEEAA